MAEFKPDGTASRQYEQRRQRYAQELQSLRRADRRFAWHRGVTFLASVLCFFWAYQYPALRLFWLVCGGSLMALFLGLAIYQDVLQRRAERLRLLDEIVRAQLGRLARDWRRVPPVAVAVPEAQRAVVRDLDVLGPASLFQLVNQAYTLLGRETLRDWLLEPAAPSEIAERQQAVQTLVEHDDLREELVLRGRMLEGSLAGPAQFVQWAEQTPLLATRRWLLWLARLTPLGFIAAVGSLAFGFATPTGASLIAVATLLANVLVSVIYTGRIHDVFNRVSTRNGELQHYRTLFELVAQLPAGANRLETIRRQAVDQDRGALHDLDRLRYIVLAASLRHAGSLSILYIVFQLAFLWDVHILAWLESWQRHCGTRVRGWFRAVGELEALGSLATLAHDHPAWCFPTIGSEGPGRFKAIALGHPLLKEAERVVNDVEIGPPGTVLLVTGSNMSGKSTLLRAIGINVLLAQAGGPVCAAALELSPLVVTTSMRIQDSLEDGVSFFMAELQRLKAIVDQATSYAECEQRTLLFLLDEILQGTNSVERHLAVVRVLHHLIAAHAMGAVSTHDLDLAKSEELASSCRVVHFRETLHDDPEGGRMTFDYKLYEGIATTRNALKLLKLVGLD